MYDENPHSKETNSTELQSRRNGSSLNGPDDKLETKEGQKKAETLFSKKFMEYLSSKNANVSSDVEKIHGRTKSPHPFLLPKEQNTSSDEATSDSSKSYKRVKRKAKEKAHPNPWLNFDYICRSKLVQCNLVKEAEEVVISEELKPFLMNMTILLQELKQSAEESIEHENIFNLISKITILITEFSRRSLKVIEEDKTGSYFKNMMKHTEGILSLISDHRKGTMADLDNGVREHKRLEKEIANKDREIDEIKGKLSSVEEKLNQKSSDLNVRVENSFLYNDRLKALIKFNQGHIKKYKKHLLEKKWTKHKLESELVHLKKKFSNVDLTDCECLDYRSIPPEPGLRTDFVAENTQHNLKNVNKKKGKTKSHVNMAK